MCAMAETQVSRAHRERCQAAASGGVIRSLESRNREILDWEFQSKDWQFEIAIQLVSKRASNSSAIDALIFNASGILWYFM
jgi:hypothetical protein